MGQQQAVLTVDVELWTWRGDYELDVQKPVARLLELVAERGVPITFFVSLSNKGLGRRPDGDYVERTLRLISQISQNDRADIAVHTHCRDLPMGFPTPADEISAYGADECAEILAWNVAQIARASGRPPCAHRAANFSLPTFGPPTFYDLLAEAGLSVDSSDISIPFSGPRKRGAILEMPPATTAYLGARHKVWSPDTMNVDEMKELASLAGSESDTLVMNCHSFMFGAPTSGRVARNLYQTWFRLPPGVQEALRPPLRVVKKVSRRVSAAPPAETSSVESRLTQVIDVLTDGGWGFTDFRTIVDARRLS